MDFRCTSRAAFTASLLDIAESRSREPCRRLPYFAFSAGLCDLPTELWTGRCAGPVTSDLSHRSRQNTINIKPGGEQSSRGAVLAVADYCRLPRPVYRCPPAAGAPSVPPTNRIQEMANLVSVCLYAGKRASVPYSAEAISPGPCVRRWDNEFLLSFGA
jgi:hypothetical protein